MTSLSSPVSSATESLRSLRRRLRQARRQLSFAQQRSAARALVRILPPTAIWKRARHIAFYQAVGGELDPHLLMETAWRQRKVCYLPVLHPLRDHHMLFVRVTPRSRYRLNRWGIAEPSLHLQQVIKPQQLDLVLMPLVGFDDRGNRIGMGQGFYDRAFAFRRGRQGKPALAGLGHECQRVAEGITPSAWDVPLDALVTPQRHKLIRDIN